MIRRYWNINLEEMMEVGVYFGYGIKKWNFRMVFYIFVKCKGIYIINFIRMVCFLLEVCDLVFDVVSRGKNFLIVGIKNKVVDLVVLVVIRVWCYYVNKKWFGGMLMNWFIMEMRF